MKRIYFKLDTNGNIVATNIEEITQYTFQEDLLQVYVPKDIVENDKYSVGVIFNSTSSEGVMSSEAYLVPYVKEQVSEGVEYYLHSRLLPKRATLYSGKQKLAFNINYLNSDSKVVSRLTSQAYEYNVIESDYELDVEEISDKDILESEIEEVKQSLDLKQDKVDTSIQVETSDTDTTMINDVATALNTLNQKHKDNLDKINTNAKDIKTNKANIESNDSDITALQGRATNLETEVENIKTQISSYFHFIGSFEYNYKGEPEDKDIENYVLSKHGTKHIGDCVLAISTYGEQDTLYICIYTGSEWAKQETAYIQRADNDNYGVVKGTERVSIASGLIQSLFVNYNDKWINIDTFYNDFVTHNNEIAEDLQALDTRITTIEKVSIPNEISNRITGDNELDSRITKEVKTLETSIASKITYNDMVDYALPRSFNDTYYIDYDNDLVSEELKETSKLESYASGQTDLGTFTLINDKYYYQLSRRNNIMARLHYYNYATNSGTLKITFNAYHHHIESGKEVVTQLCSYTQDLVIVDDNNIHTIEIDATLNSLESNVISVVMGDYFTYEIFITNNTSETFVLAFFNNKAYTSTIQYTCAQDPIVNLNFIDVVDETLIFEKQGSVEDETLYL